MKILLSKEEAERILLDYINTKFSTTFNDIEISHYGLSGTYATFSFVEPAESEKDETQ